MSEDPHITLSACNRRGHYTAAVRLRSGDSIAITGPQPNRILAGLRMLASHVGRNREGLEQPSPAVKRKQSYGRLEIEGKDNA
ncbi:hypothetical protein [Cerasicoccus maritimus]|uniref:hypothetical protein n=1 Tax=Cerasicoccus maritimus TaxID=490089 RepID=UPI002852D9B0|nr:hypothetical protein [Cerasicoccus maritimus]